MRWWYFDELDKKDAEIERLRAALKDVMLHVPLYHENEDKHDRVHAAIAAARRALERQGGRRMSNHE
jgi:hypothetical protein